MKPEVLSELQKLRDEFKSLGFLVFRQTIADHKNKDIIINPMYLNLTFPSKISLQALKNIFLKLNKLASANLDLTWFTTVSQTEKGLKEILKQIDIVFIESKSVE